MNHAELHELLADFKLPADLRGRLEETCHDVAGALEARWLHRLLVDYGYGVAQLGAQVPLPSAHGAEPSPDRADLVVYRDRERKVPLLVLALADVGRAAGIVRAEAAARALGAEYHAWSDGQDTVCFKTSRRLNTSTPVADLPLWTEGRLDPHYVSRTRLLPPFRDETELREVVRRCHDKIFFTLGHDPAKSFDELMKVLFLKIFDERDSTKECFEFAILPGQTPAQLAGHIRTMFGDAVSSARYADIFAPRFGDAQPVTLDLDDETIAFIVAEFQGFSLVNTTATLEGVDIKGTVFEKMVGATFRGELGAYFTPRELVEFCVDVMAPGIGDTILDPSCGSGGFLIMVIKAVIERLRRGAENPSESEIYAKIREFCEHNVFGVDINERMVRVTKMNLMMHGDAHAGIFHSHGLQIGMPGSDLPIAPGSISHVFSNPPFAGREADPALLQRFASARNEGGEIVSVNKALPFVEMIVHALKPGGKAALVLPNGIFNSTATTHRKLRDVLFAETRILGVIGLPHRVFFHTGCDVQGSILFLEKRQPADPCADYDVFIDWADHVGFDVKGLKTRENDLPAIAARFRERSPDRLVHFSVLQKHGRFDPLFYRPGELPAAPKGWLKLRDLAEPREQRVPRKARKSGKFRYLEVGGVDPVSGRILELCEGAALPSRAAFIVQSGMVLQPNHRNSIAAMRAPVLVDDAHDGIVVTSRFIPLFCKVPPAYVWHVLNQPAVKKRLLATVTGGSSTEIRWESIRDMPVPGPPDGDYAAFMADILATQAQMEQLDEQLRACQRSLATRFDALFRTDDAG